MTANFIRAIVVMASSAAGLALTGSVGAADQSLIDAAKNEGEVTWYTTQIITQFARPVADAFQRRYGIKINTTRGGSVEVAVKLLNEYRAGGVHADVFDGTSTAAAVKSAGVAMKWLPDPANRLPREFRDSEGYWVATNLNVHTPAFNTNLVLRGTEPRTWQDLLDPKWKGKMAWTAHATSSGGPGFMGLVVRELGEEKGMAYLAALAKQGVIGIGSSGRSVTDQAIAGEYPIVLQIFNHQPVISARQGAPIDWIPMSPAMVIANVVSVAAGSPHPNAAKLFVDFLVSDEGQSLFRDHDYIPVKPTILPREPTLRPDGKNLRAIFFTPEEVAKGLPRWVKIYNDLFR